MLAPTVKNRLSNPDGKLAFSRGPDGSWIVKHVETGEVNADALKRIMKGSELMTGEAYQQQMRKFQGTPALQQAFGTFDNYMNSQLNAIATKLAHKYENETYKHQIKVNTPEGTRAKTKLEDMIGSSEITQGARVEDVAMGVQPMFVPDVDKASEGRTIYQEKKDLIINGGKQLSKDYSGNIIEIDKPPLQERLYELAGIPMPTEDDQGKLVENEDRVSFSLSEHPMTGGIQAVMKFYNPDTGKMEEIDLINSPDIHRKGDVLANVIKSDYGQFLNDLGMLNYEVVEANSFLNHEKHFTERAVAHAFGEYDENTTTPYGRILKAYEEQYGTKAYMEDIVIGPEKKFLSAFNVENLGQEALEALANGKGLLNTSVSSAGIERIMSSRGGVTPHKLQKILGLKEEAFQTPVSKEPTMEAFVHNVINGNVQLPSWLFGEDGITEEGQARIALQKFRDDGHEMATRYDKA